MKKRQKKKIKKKQLQAIIAIVDNLTKLVRSRINAKKQV